MPPPRPKIVVGQRYELEQVVGQGGYGVVYRARDRTSDRSVAVKVLGPGAGADPHVFERLLREQQAMNALQGTSAVTAIDLCRSPNGSPCLVMEWLEGMDLEHHLEALELRQERMSIDRLLAMLGPVVQTLGRAHQLGIVHRDIKPANIFLLSAGGVRLLDFGLSRTKSSLPLTAAGTVMGSPSYIAPEVWRGNSSAVDHRADLYSLAVIVFRALTGQIPFPTESLLEKLNLVTTAPRPRMREFRPDLAPGMDDWTEQALAIDPAFRFNTAQGLFTALVLSLELSEDAVRTALNRAASPLASHASAEQRGHSAGPPDREHTPESRENPHAASGPPSRRARSHGETGAKHPKRKRR